MEANLLSQLKSASLRVSAQVNRIRLGQQVVINCLFSKDFEGARCGSALFISMALNPWGFCCKTVSGCQNIAWQVSFVTLIRLRDWLG